MSEYIEIWERIWFSKNEAVKWEKSFDKGKTWEQVNWPGEKLPFVLFNPAEVDYVIEKSWRAASESR